MKRGKVSAPSGADDPVEEYASQLLGEASEELVRADSKAATLLAGGAVVVGIIVNAAISDKWSPGDLVTSSHWLWWFGAVIFCVGVAVLGYAIYPRTGKVERRRQLGSRVYYFGHATTYATPDDLLPNLLESSRNRLARDVNQFWHVSDITMKKYRCIRVALRCYSIGVLCCGAAGVWSYLAS